MGTFMKGLKDGFSVIQKALGSYSKRSIVFLSRALPSDRLAYAVGALTLAIAPFGFKNLFHESRYNLTNTFGQISALKDGTPNPPKEFDPKNTLQVNHIRAFCKAYDEAGEPSSRKARTMIYDGNQKAVIGLGGQKTILSSGDQLFKISSCPAAMGAIRKELGIVPVQAPAQATPQLKL